MKIRMTLIAKDLKITKICKSQKEVRIFKRDVPARYNLLFSGKPYVIGEMPMP